MFTIPGQIYAAAYYSVQAQAKIDATETERLKQLPKAEFDREMRIREVVALERQAAKRPHITINSSIF